MTDKQWDALGLPIECWAVALEKHSPRKPALPVARDIARAHVLDLFRAMQAIRDVRQHGSFCRNDLECFLIGRGSDWILKVPKLKLGWAGVGMLVAGIVGEVGA